MIVLYFSMQVEDIIEDTNIKCHLCMVQSTWNTLYNIGMHLITLL